MFLALLQDNAINDKHVTSVYALIVSTFFAVLLGKKLYYRFTTNQEYIILPRLQTNGISSVSMITAMNIALIITISMLSNQMMGWLFKIYPGARFLVENILIKIGGILFGPIIGAFIGFSTDLLTVILTSSVLNYGYFVSAIMNGFLGGLINLLIRMKDPKKYQPAGLAAAMAIGSLIYLGILLFSNHGGDSLYRVQFLSLSFSLPWSLIFIFVTFMLSIALTYLWISVLAVNRVNEEEFKDVAWVHKYAKLYEFFLIFVVNCAIYLIVDIIALPLFDIKLSALPYEQFLVARIVTSIPSVILFTNIIWYIYQLHNDIRGNLATQKNPTWGLMPIKKKEKRVLPVLL
ncbi:glutamyl-tRNA amidotransferase [Candidatus Mycoplasma haematobovis]|uniref:Glutamyl-tRNA amidotransferase n=1 Tax=Candidatus Mycoplasma haematobovis TaxID=432608 RepID=A0A1A9QEL1_9MOLU|nr:glutamyl-tRNA amidotransferase [Candidatus Mycoplasma haematobovis]OAL10120.1 glutamyl-tRNA amidotransferase [Candidatus Mycoplasma haematobovis]